MRLLLDQNLSRHLVEWLATYFPDTRHVTSLGLATASDEEIWKFARAEGYTIVSKDTDFHHLSFRYGPPPKTVWLRLGNCSTSQIAECLSRNIPALVAFHDDPESGLMVVTRDSVESRGRGG